MKKFIAISFISLLSACGSNDEPLVNIEHDDVIENADIIIEPSNNLQLINNAKNKIKSEPAVIDLNYEPTDFVQWHIAVKDDGSKRYGYAEYICLVLSDIGFDRTSNNVRIVDVSKISEFGDAYRDYSLGAVRCSDAARLD